MQTATFFGIEWEISYSTFHAVSPILELHNSSIGKFFIAHLQPDGPEKNWFKMISLIHEKSIFNKPYFIVPPTFIEHWKNELSSTVLEITICSYEECLSSFPSSIDELQKRILLLLNKKYPEFGTRISGTEIHIFHFFSKNNTDFKFIFNSMKNKGFIEAITAEDDSDDCDFIVEMQIGENGWKIIQNVDKPNASKQGFIAMWFDSKMTPARDSIKKAIKSAHFEHQVIDEKHFNEQIPAEILEEIKNSSFIVADLTGQRNGVYFEAGFALGNNIPVIFSCKQDELDKVHFDIKQYNIVLWNNEEELFEKLKDRINGTITY